MRNVVTAYKGFSLELNKHGNIDIFWGSYLRMTCSSVKVAKAFVDTLGSR